MKFLIVAGGTGGHISPGVAIYKKIKENPENKVVFVTNPHGLKFPIIKLNISNDDLVVIPISKGFSRNILRNFQTLKEFFVSFFISLRLVFSFSPDRVILTGGYVSGSVGLASAILRKKIILLEQNSVMGFTNKVLSFFAEKVILTFPLKGRKKYSRKYERIGNPVRYEDKDIIMKDSAKNTYGFSGDDKVVGIVLGSQGAKRVNEVILNCIEELAEEYKIVWVTGQEYYDDIVSKCKELKNVKIFPFINDVNVFMSAVDVIISRAGASTLAELSFFGVPAVLIPFPYASNNHQYYNAIFFESHGAGIVVEESELSLDKLLSVLDLLFKNLDIFKSNVKKLFPSDVTQKVLNKILEI